jgi:hypothetical protein
MYLRQYNDALKRIDPNSKEYDRLPDDLLDQIQLFTNRFEPEIIIRRIERYVQDQYEKFSDAAK